MAVDFASFLANIPSPVQRVQEGVLLGQQQSDRAQAQRTAREAAVQRKALNDELLALSENENKTPEDFIDLMTRFPELADKFKAPLEALTDIQKQTALEEATSVFAALEGGQTDIALNILKRRKEAAEAAGDVQGATQADIMIQTIELNPDAAKSTTGLFLASELGAEKFSDLFGKISPPKKAAAEKFTTLSKDEAIALGFSPDSVIQKSEKTGKFFVAQGPRGKGQSFTISPDGTVVFEQGGSGELTRRTKGNIQQDLINNQQQLSQLDAALRNFDPEFLKIEPRFNALVTSLSEKVGFEPSEQDKDFLSRFTTFKSDSLAQMNTQLKIRSGTAVTQSEFTRLKGELPVVGTGILDGDSPTEYMAKSKAIIRSLKMADARLHFALNKGLDFSSIPLNSINGIIDARGEELLSEGLSDEEVEKILKDEFGL